MKKTPLVLALVSSLAFLAPAMALELNHTQLLKSDRLQAVNANSVQLVSGEKVVWLKAQLENLTDGQVLTIPSGRYANLGVVSIKANNVKIQAEKPGHTWLTGLVQLKVEGNGVQLSGLVFTDGGPAERFGGVRIHGDNAILENTTFYDFNHAYAYEPDERRAEYPKYLWVSVWGEQAQLLNNRFEKKHKRGTLIGVQKNATPDHHIIKHNLFYDQKQNQYNELAIKKAVRYNANSWEAIRIGDSKSSQWPSESQVVENLFVDMDGERELISLKSGGNAISGNTFFNSASMISLRHGKANRVENNIIDGNLKNLTGGIRIYDEDHVFSNNYITRTRGSEGEVAGNADLRGSVVINTGIIDVANGEKLSQAVKGKELNKQWTPKNITVSHNTMDNVQWGIVHGDQTHRVSLFDNSEVKNIFAGVDIHFDHNLVNAQVAARASTQYPLKATYNNEVYIGDVVEPQLMNDFVAEAKLVKDAQGFITSSVNGVKVGADLSKLKIMTTDVVGPDYQINW